MDDVSRIIIDGELQKSTKPAVSVTSRGLLYGDGCFETFRAYHGCFLRLNVHLERLKEGLTFLGIRYPERLKIEMIYSQLHQLLKENKLLKREAIVRLQVWRKGKRGYRVGVQGNGHYSIAANPIINNTDSCRLATVDIKRIPSAALPSKYKLSNGINYIIAAKQAQSKGAEDALMETVQGWVSETTIANIFWKSNETVFTPSKTCDILPGVTRSITLELLKKLKIDFKEGEFRIEDLKKADSVWVCNSVKEILPVSQVDNTYFETETSFFRHLKRSFEAYRDEHLMKRL